MNFNDFYPYIEHYGYLTLFFFLWLGIIGVPIPDEMVAMGGGFVSTIGVLNMIPAFIATYLGVVSGLTLGYVLGRLFGSTILNKLMKKKKTGYLHSAQNMVNKYGNYALVIGYFFPIVRHIIPYIAGINRMPFKTYALYSYSVGFVWTLIYFLLGIYFGQYIEEIALFTTKYGLIILGVLFVGLILNYIFRKIRNHSL